MSNPIIIWISLQICYTNQHTMLPTSIMGQQSRNVRGVMQTLNAKSHHSCQTHLCMSSAGRSSSPIIMLRPNWGSNLASSSMTCTKPLVRLNSTWKYGKLAGMLPLRPCKHSNVTSYFKIHFVAFVSAVHYCFS